MATIEIIVKDREHKGKGDNFIVEWHAEKPGQAPIIHTIASNVQGKIVCSNEGVIIKDRLKKVEETLETES